MTTPTPEPIPAYGGCLWPMDPACRTDEWTALDETVKDRALALASSTLQRLTGGRVSNCPIKVRPCKPGSYAYQTHMIPQYGVPFQPGMDALGQWINTGCCSAANCECQVACEVMLPAPVGRVDEVRVDGAVVDPAYYRVDGSRLVWTAGGDCGWPATQDLSRSDAEQDTFSVTYLNAYPVDSLGAYAVGILALEYAKACVGNKCRLPAGVTNISRQGITMEVASGAFPGGLTGIREVDSFIAIWNPGGMVRQASVWSPDMHTPRVTR